MNEYIWYFPFWVGSPHSISCFLDLTICLQISRCLYYFCCIVLHCVNIPHFPCQFFGRGLFLGRYWLWQTNATMNIVEHMSLWYNWASFGYICKSGIAGSWGRLFPNLLRNHHTDIQRDYTSLHSHQQWRSVPFTSYPLQHSCHQWFCSWPFW